MKSDADRQRRRAFVEELSQAIPVDAVTVVLARPAGRIEREQAAKGVVVALPGLLDRRDRATPWLLVRYAERSSLPLDSRPSVIQLCLTPSRRPALRVASFRVAAFQTSLRLNVALRLTTSDAPR
jgi:hypothetical protein